MAGKYAREISKRLKIATLLHDEFFVACMQDNIPCVKKMIHLILGRDDLEITKMVTQKEFRSLMRSVRLDVYASDANHAIYDIEIQTSNEGADEKRARFYSSVLDVNHLKKGEDFKKLPESYVIFITEHDVLKRGQAVYTIHRYIDGLNEHFDDEQHIIYVNCAVSDDGSELWKLIHDMNCADPDEMLVSELAERVSFFKKTRKGRTKMSKLFADIIEKERAAGEAKGEAIGLVKGEAIGLAKGEAKGIAKAEAKAQHEKEGFVSNIIKAGTMTLDKIAEAFNMSLAEVQILAAQAKL